KPSLLPILWGWRIRHNESSSCTGISYRDSLVREFTQAGRQRNEKEQERADTCRSDQGACLCTRLLQGAGGGRLFHSRAAEAAAELRREQPFCHCPGIRGC